LAGDSRLGRTNQEHTTCSRDVLQFIFFASFPRSDQRKRESNPVSSAGVAAGSPLSAPLGGDDARTADWRYELGNCTDGVDREIATSSGVISAGMLAKSGVER
jgi:hypothetical protein